MATAKDKRYEELRVKLADEKASVVHWRERALVGERMVQTLTQKYGTLNQSYYNLLKELEETKKRLPSGATLTYIDNLVRINEAYRRELVGDRVNFWERIRFLGRLVFLKG